MQNLHRFGLQSMLRLPGGWLLIGMVELRITSILATRSCLMVNRGMYGVVFDAAPEWQVMSLGWRSRRIVVACPLERLVGLP
jgi:hypothetical protein